MTELIALRPFRFGNRYLRVGESFSAPDGLASFYITVGRAKRAAVCSVPPVVVATVSVEAEVDEPKPKRRRRTYKRRDLRAED